MNQGLFAGKTTVITGGAHGIGRAIADAFLREGAKVHIIDIQPGDWFVGDVSRKEDLERFAASVIEKSGQVDYLVNNALPIMKGIDDCTWDEFSFALAVGVTAPFYLTKLLMPHFAPGAAVINIASSRDRMEGNFAAIKPIYTRTKPRQKTNDAVMPESALGKGLSDILFMCIQMLLSSSQAASQPVWKTPGIFSKSTQFLLPAADRRGENRDQRSRWC